MLKTFAAFLSFIELEIEVWTDTELLDNDDGQFSLIFDILAVYY